MHAGRQLAFCSATRRSTTFLKCQSEGAQGPEAVKDIEKKDQEVGSQGTIIGFLRV